MMRRYTMAPAASHGGWDEADEREVTAPRDRQALRMARDLATYIKRAVRVQVFEARCPVPTRTFVQHPVTR